MLEQIESSRAVAAMGTERPISAQIVTFVPIVADVRGAG